MAVSVFEQRIWMCKKEDGLSLARWRIGRAEAYGGRGGKRMGTGMGKGGMGEKIEDKDRI